MTLNFTWNESNDPLKRGYHYLRVDGICVGSVCYSALTKQDVERPYYVAAYLPQGKPYLNRFSKIDEAKGALEIAVKKWFKNFGVE